MSLCRCSGFLPPCREAFFGGGGCRKGRRRRRLLSPLRNFVPGSKKAFPPSCLSIKRRESDKKGDEPTMKTLFPALPPLSSLFLVRHKTFKVRKGRGEGRGVNFCRVTAAPSKKKPEKTTRNGNSRRKDLYNKSCQMPVFHKGLFQNAGINICMNL